MKNENIDLIIKDLNKRSKSSRLEGIAYVLLILTICSVILFSFVKFGGVSNITNIQIEEKAVLEKPININNTSELSEIISSLVLRLGAVMLAIYLIQILVGFARYRFKVSEIHAANANALILSNNDIEKFTALSSALSPNQEFGKMPTNPYDKAYDLVRDVASKINTKNLSS